MKFGHYKEAKLLLDEAYSHGLLPDVKGSRILSDFTGDTYRLIFEAGFDSLDDFEQSLAIESNRVKWQKWNSSFIAHVASSHREILKQIM